MKLTKHQILVSIRLFSSVGIAPRLFFDVIGKIIISVLIIKVMMDDSALLVCMFVLNCIADISKKGDFSTSFSDDCLFTAIT
jgi:hypothetical protein